MARIGGYVFFLVLHKQNHLEVSTKDEAQQVRKARTTQCLNFSGL